MFQLFGCMLLGFVAGVIAGLLNEKTKKRKLLKMENDMLKNHSRILSLQQKVSSLESENNRLAKK